MRLAWPRLRSVSHSSARTPWSSSERTPTGGGLVFGFDREMAALLLLLRQRRESNLFSHMHGLRCRWFSGWYRLGVYLRPASSCMCAWGGGGRNVCVLRLNPPSNTLLYLIGEAFHGGWIPPWAPHTQNFAYIKASGPSGPYLFHRTTGQNQKGPGRMCVRELGCKDVQRKKDAHVRACSCCCCCI